WDPPSARARRHERRRERELRRRVLPHQFPLRLRARAPVSFEGDIVSIRRTLQGILLAAASALAPSVASAGAPGRILEYPVGAAANGLATNPDGSAIYYANGGTFWALFPADGSTAPLTALGATSLRLAVASADTFWMTEPAANKIWSHPFHTGIFTGLT